MRIVLPLTDEPVVAQGLRSLIEGSGNFLLDALSFDVENLAERVLEARPDVVLVNYSSDLRLTALARLCGRPSQCRTMLLVRDPSPELLCKAQDAGFSGLLDSRCSRSEFLATLERCGCDEFGFARPQTLGSRPVRSVRMSPREGQLVSLLGQGLKNKEIATCLGLSEGTVKVYLSKLFKKAGAKDRLELALIGVKNMVEAVDIRPRSVGSYPFGIRGDQVRPKTLVLTESVVTQ